MPEQDIKLSVEFVNANQLLQEFDKLPANTQSQIGNQAALDLALFVASHARAIAPRGPTGHLRTTIKVDYEILTATYIRLAVHISRVEFIGRDFYARYVELGSKHQKAQRFLSRAAEAGRRAAPWIWAAATERGIPAIGRQSKAK